MGILNKSIILVVTIACLSASCSSGNSYFQSKNYQKKSKKLKVNKNKTVGPLKVEIYRWRRDQPISN